MYRVVVRQFVALGSVCFLMLCAGMALAHTPDQAPHQQYTLESFTLQNGQKIAPFVQSYVTHGVLNAARDNAILMLAPFAGNHHHNEWLIGPGKALDTDKYFVICADPLGNGLSSSPSTGGARGGMLFPDFTVADMVTAEHRMVQHLGIHKLAAVIGASMGGMQSLQWGASYPDEVARVIALVPSGRASGWTRTQLALLRQAIQLDPAWNNGAYTRPPEQGLRLFAGMMFALLLHTPKQVDAATSAGPDAALKRLEHLQQITWNIMDANDLLYQAAAIEHFDLAASHDNNYTSALQSLTMPVLLLAGKKDLLCPEDALREDANHMPHARFELILPEQELGHAAGIGLTPEVRQVLQQKIAEFLAEKS